MHESQVAYLKLQAHTASLQSLKECYCRYAHMLDGARTMFNAYQQTTTRRDSIEQVKLGLKECTQVSFYFDLLYIREGVRSYIIDNVIQKYCISKCVEMFKEICLIFRTVTTDRVFSCYLSSAEFSLQLR